MAKTRSTEAANQEGEPSNDLATQVAKLQEQMVAMMEMMSNLASQQNQQGQQNNQQQAEQNRENRQASNPRSRTEHLQGQGSDSMIDEEEEEEGFPSTHQEVSGKTTRPFQVEAKIDIPSFDGAMDASQLDSWLDQLETYFSLYGYTSQEKVMFARLKLTNHALVWWNAHLRSGQQNVSWSQFKQLIRQEFYPLGYEEDRWTRWHGLQQQTGQTVQDFTTEFRRMALSMRISLEEISAITKYVAGLHTYIADELRLFPVQTFGQASGMAMAIERKYQNQRGLTSTSQENKNNGMKNKWKGTTSEQTSTTSSPTTKTGLYCEHCKLSNHNQEKCWKLHPEFFPEKFKQQGDKGKRVAVAVEADPEGRTLTSLIEADPDLSLMVGKIKVPIREKDPREELFTLRVQVKKELVNAIIDPGCMTNLISANLVQRLGLETSVHPRPHTLHWLQTSTGVRVDQQCKLRFAISRDYIDEVVCDVVPLEICQLLLGSPYLWDRDAAFRRRAQQYQLTKDGVRFVVNRSEPIKSEENKTAGHVSRTMYSCRFVLLTQKEETKIEEAGRSGIQSNQNSKTKPQQKTSLKGEIVLKKSSRKTWNLQKPEGCHDGQSKVRQVHAPKKINTVCTDGRLKTTAEEKETAPDCTDGRWKLVTYKKKKKTPACTDGRLGRKKNKNDHCNGKTQVVHSSTKNRPATQMVVQDNKNTNKEAKQKERGRQTLPHPRQNLQE